MPSALAGGVVADPAEAVVGDARRAAAADGDLGGGLVVELDPQLGGVAADDLGQLLDAVEIEVLADLEAVAQAGPRAGRCGSWRRSA